MSSLSEASPPVQRGFTKERREARAAKLASAAAQPSLAAVTTAEAQPVSADPQTTAQRHTRTNRKPFGSTNQKLAYPPREGYHRHWFNDNPGRIEYATEEAGYTHVKDPRTGKNVQRVVGTREGGQPITAFLLEIPQEWFDDDMARYEEENAARDETIRRGVVSTDATLSTQSREQKLFRPEAQGRRIQIDQSTRRR